ncbi:uncharacterized protein LOC127832082 [Dreissena polymorpha]|uniref:uncharacterized protein LOC127832082 n=1 Tax=Dreissena polymorpha TaxID=45954 RepID=UPI0022656685|nr:uncharacterized protein LOC127832082 [Dreissena polymorpha]
MLRQLTRQDAYFLVRYRCDGKLQIRTSGFFQTTDEIQCHQSYTVQWGTRKTQTVDAVVLARGTEKEMRLQMKAKASEQPTAQTQEPPKKRAKKTHEKTKANVITYVASAGSSASTTRPSTATSGPVTEITTVVPEVAAVVAGTGSVIDTTEIGVVPTVVPEVAAVVAGPGTLIDVTSVVPEVVAVVAEMGRVTDTTVIGDVTSVVHDVVAVVAGATPTMDRNASSAVANASSTVIRHSTPPSTSANVFRIGRPHHMCSQLLSMEASMRSMAAEVEKLRKLREADRREIEENRAMQMRMLGMIETLLKNQERSQTVPPPTTTSTTESGIAEQYTLSHEELRSIHQASLGPGNFAAHLTSGLFPELFGVSQLKHEFNWKGGGKNHKKPLSPQRKNVIKHYVGVFYPEALAENVWRDSVVPKVNELLRRQGREERRMRRDAGTSADINGYMEDLHGMLPEINTSCDTSLLSLLNNSM